MDEEKSFDAPLWTLANKLLLTETIQIPVQMQKWQVLNSFYCRASAIDLQPQNYGMNCWPSGSRTPKRNTLPPRALCIRLQLWKRTVVCRPRDKPSLCLSFFSFSVSPSLSPCLHLSSSFSTSSLDSLSLNIFSHTNRHPYKLWQTLDAPLSYSLVLFGLCWQKSPHSNPKLDDLCAFTFTWLWKYWLWEKHSIKLPSLPTRTAESSRYNSSYDLDFPCRGHRLQCHFASSVLLTLH